MRKQVVVTESIIRTFIFVAFITAFGVLGAFLPDREYSPQENRYLTTASAPSLQSLASGEYMRRFDRYLTDQFPMRDTWVSLKAISQKEAGQKENNDVFFAGIGYLIGKPLTDDGDILERNLSGVLGLRDAGYDTGLLVSPMAAEVLRDRLPRFAYDPVQRELLSRLKAEAGDVFIDVGQGLHEADAMGYQVFFRTDHHWTMRGAYEAYVAYMNWLGEEPFLLESYDTRVASETFYGTLWSKSSHPGIKPDRIVVFEIKDFDEVEVEYTEGSRAWTVSGLYQPEYLEQKDKYAYFLGQNRPLAVIRHTRGPNTERKLLIFKDSYAHSFAPFLLPHFDEIHLVDLRYYKQDPIAYMLEHDISQVLFLYNADNFATERSVSQVGAYLSMH